MKTEYNVLEQLRDYISEHLCEYYDDEDYATEFGVEIDFPNTDNMKYKTMFFIEPESVTLEDLTQVTDLAQMTASVYIFCKRDSQENLIKRVFFYFNSFYKMVRSNDTLDNFVDFTKITSSEFYPAVEATGSITCIQAYIQFTWSKDFSN